MTGVQTCALPILRIIEGRAPGVGEILVGDMAHRRMGASAADLRVGQTLWFDNREWRISGRFEAPNTVMESEIWTPLTELQIATRQDNFLSCVIITLDDATFEDVETFATERLYLELTAIRESDYYRSLYVYFRPIRAMIWVSALLISVGALLGGLNTLYAAFSSRVAELGVLQTIGYGRAAIALSMAQETGLASAVGALIAAGIGLIALDGVGIRFSMGAFRLQMNATAIGFGLASGLFTGLIGAALPAARYLSIPMTDALKHR